MSVREMKQPEPPRRKFNVIRCNPLELWDIRKRNLARGLGYVEVPHPRGKAYYFRPVLADEGHGIDTFNGEDLPRYGA